jgi:ribosomal protein L11 methyltransferase
LRVSQGRTFAQAEGVIKNLRRWTRLSSIKWEDAWAERLRFLGPERVAFITWPDSRALKIEAYCDEATAKRLVKGFGGKATKIAPHIWTGNPQQPRGPLSIRGKLQVYADEASWKKWNQANRKPRGIFIPAGMAFGTGEHATTATCLRLLADLVSDLPADFSVLDLGTGSGILAIGAEALGAGRVDAIDYDPAAVRIARQNARANRCRRITCTQGDVLQLQVKKPVDLTMANLFSDVLIAAAPRLARATKPGSWLVFSGVLRKQSSEVARALQQAGFAKPKIIPRGKWCAGICQKTLLTPSRPRR